MARKQPTSILRRNAKEIKSYRVLLRLTPAIIGIVALLLALVYVISVLYSKYGSFTVAISKDSLKHSLTLCYVPTFDEPTSLLNAGIAEDITNIDGLTLPEDLDAHNGEHNGENYAAYTFYCKNAGVDTVTYRHTLYIANATNGIEAACRFRVYVNGEPTTYALVGSNGKPEPTPPPGTTEFLTDRIVMEGDVEHFKPGDVTKYTVVIWLEGWDPECIDPVVGGQMKVDMTMTVIEVEEPEE